MKRQIHITQAQTFWMCGERYRRRYVCGEKVPPGVAITIGVTTHKTNAHSLIHKRDTTELLTLEEIQDTARDTFVYEWDKVLNEHGQFQLTEDEEAKGMDKLHAENLDMSVKLASLYHTDYAPIIQPAKVEDPWVLELNNFPFDLAGTIDLQETPARKNTVRDTKTAGKTPPADKADTSPQITMYALAVKVFQGEIPPLAMDFLIKTKVPKSLTLETTRCEKDFQILLRRLENMAEAVEKEVFTPTTPDNWSCAPRWCGYFTSCPYRS